MHITYNKIISNGGYQFKRLEELQLDTRTYTIVLPNTINKSTRDVKIT